MNERGFGRLACFHGRLLALEPSRPPSVLTCRRGARLSANVGQMRQVNDPYLA
jgi:hypothetical protein